MEQGTRLPYIVGLVQIGQADQPGTRRRLPGDGGLVGLSQIALAAARPRP